MIHMTHQTVKTINIIYYILVLSKKSKYPFSPGFHFGHFHFFQITHFFYFSKISLFSKNWLFLFFKNSLFLFFKKLTFFTKIIFISKYILQIHLMFTFWKYTNIKSNIHFKIHKSQIHFQNTQIPKTQQIPKYFVSQTQNK